MSAKRRMIRGNIKDWDLVGIYCENRKTRTSVSEQLEDRARKVMESLWKLDVQHVLSQEGGTKLLLFPRTIQHSQPDFLFPAAIQHPEIALDLDAIAELFHPFSPDLIVSHGNPIRFISM